MNLGGVRRVTFCVASCCVFACAACGDAFDVDTPNSACGSVRQALFGGEEDVPADVRDTVGAAWFPAEDGAEEICTLVRVAPGVMLTAAHCIGTSDDVEVAVSFDDDLARAASPQQRSCETTHFTRVVVSKHGVLDLAVLHAQGMASVSPVLPIAKSPPTVGDQVTLVGYGEQENGAFGQRESLDGLVMGVDGPSIQVHAIAPGAGACSGDSGGPLLRMTANGPELLGVLSRGSQDCQGTDLYTATDAARDWLERTIRNAKP